MFLLAKIVVFAFIAYGSVANVISSIISTTNLTPGQVFTIVPQKDMLSTVTLTLRKENASEEQNGKNNRCRIPKVVFPLDQTMPLSGSEGDPNSSDYFGIASESATASAASGTSEANAATLPTSPVTDSLISTFIHKCIVISYYLNPRSQSLVSTTISSSATHIASEIVSVLGLMSI